MKKVKQEHQKIEVQILQTMLNAVGFNLDYQHTDLISRTLKINTKKATIQDCLEVRKQWLKEYENQDLYVEI